MTVFEVVDAGDFFQFSPRGKAATEFAESTLARYKEWSGFIVEDRAEAAAIIADMRKRGFSVTIDRTY